MFQNVCLMLATPLRGTQGRLCYVLMKNYPLMFSIKILLRLSGTQGAGGNENENEKQQGHQRRGEDR